MEIGRVSMSLWLHQGSGLPVRYVTKTWSVVLLNKKIHIFLSQVYCVRQVVKTPTVILNNPVFSIVLKQQGLMWQNGSLSGCITYQCRYYGCVCIFILF